MRKALIAVFSLAFSPLLFAQQALNNDAVVKLVKAGLSDDLVISTINASRGTYDTSADAVVALKKAGASDKVIAAVVAKASTPVTAAPALSPSALPAGVDKVAVYYKDSGNKWQQLPCENVVFQSGGLLKHIATAGLVKQDLNGVIGGSRSKVVVSAPVTLILHVPDGRTANDYQLLRLHPNGNNRQFQSVAGGLAKTTPGNTRDLLNFTSAQIGPSEYQIVLGGDVGQGEFGFLEPAGTPSGAPPTSAKIDTFAFVN